MRYIPLSESQITRILGLHGLPHNPPHPLWPSCPPAHFAPPALPQSSTLCPTYGVCIYYTPSPHLPTQSAFNPLIRLIRDSDTYPRPSHHLRQLSESQITQILGLHELPRNPSHPLCPSCHLRPSPHLRSPIQHPLPHLRRLDLLHAFALSANPIRLSSA